MATNETYVMTSHNLLNYSGLLFNKGNSKVPFSTIIGGKFKTTDHWAFPLVQEWEVGGGTSQPAITETASLTAPNPEFKTRTQKSNVCQIYQRALSISYGKLSSQGQLSGLNYANNEANPATELDFQVAAAMSAIANDIEYTFLNGAYQDGNYDDVAYKTRGIITACSTNTKSASSAGLGFWLVADLIESIASHGGDTSNLILMARPVHIMQLNADAVSNGMTIVPAGRDINGIKIDTLITPFGACGIVPNARVAEGKALIFNPDVCSPVYMPIPGKGNFFLEALGKSGAADKYQIYGQCGLDYGAEQCHGTITSLSTSFSAPSYSKSVYVAGVNGTVNANITNTTAAPVNTKEVTA